MSYHVGYDHFTPDPGTWESASCLACGTACDVIRDCEGPTSSIMAMAGSKRKYDKFICPNSGQDWHNQIIGLKEQIKSTPSNTLANLMREEIDVLLTTKKATKKVGYDK